MKVIAKNHKLSELESLQEIHSSQVPQTAITTLTETTITEEQPKVTTPQDEVYSVSDSNAISPTITTVTLPPPGGAVVVESSAPSDCVK